MTPGMAAAASLLRSNEPSAFACLLVGLFIGFMAALTWSGRMYAKMYREQSDSWAATCEEIAQSWHDLYRRKCDDYWRVVHEGVVAELTECIDEETRH